MSVAFVVLTPQCHVQGYATLFFCRPDRIATVNPLLLEFRAKTYCRMQWRLSRAAKMKRLYRPGKSPAPSRARAKIPDYCDVDTRRDAGGNVIWPAAPDAMAEAGDFILECAKSNKPTLLVPDKDADGLSAGVILERTLIALGLSKSLIKIHLIKKGSNIHEEDERLAMAAHSPAFVVVLDQGSREGPPVVDDVNAKSLIIDHHLSDTFPQHAQVVSACHYPPVSTTSLLTYEICRRLRPEIGATCAYLACIGTHGDLGNTLKWSPPFPDMKETFKMYTKKAINDAVSLLNAPRRTARYDVITAWSALAESQDPRDLLRNGRLQAARAEINEEVELNAHSPPKFTPDGRLAVLKIRSKAQVHPVIATRWANHLNSQKLEIVMVANYGYLDQMVNFSCRIARCARTKDPPVNIIEMLKAAADLSADGLRERMGDSFARGHPEASGGIVPVPAFEELMRLLKVGDKPENNPRDGRPRKRAKTIEIQPQTNTLGNYFKKL